MIKTNKKDMQKEIQKVNREKRKEKKYATLQESWRDN